MKALVWTAAHEMSWMEVAQPRVPQSGWIRVVSLATGICGSEISAYLGHNELRTPPLVMGHEFSARMVEDVPEKNLYAGDIVTVNPLVTCGQCRACLAGQRQRCLQRQIIGIDFPGSMGEEFWVPADQCFKVDDPIAGALVEPLACAVRAVNQAQTVVGDVVIVIGAGIIGLMSAWVARAQGARWIVVTDTNTQRLRQAEVWGATDVLDARTPDLATEIRRMLPDGADAVIDAVGFESTRVMSLETVRRGGRVVWIGLHENLTTLPANQCVRDETEIVGSFCYTDEEFRRAVALVNQGFLPPFGQWLDVRPMRDGAAAFQEQAEGPAPFAKIVLQMA
ncbi:MAG: zinc-binding dehydrogenase [Firmicutes bacterium]|nr:zinc-binding dehydrogenase [Bacillota bacterium]